VKTNGENQQTQWGHRHLELRQLGLRRQQRLPQGCKVLVRVLLTVHALHATADNPVLERTVLETLRDDCCALCQWFTSPICMQLLLLLVVGNEQLYYHRFRVRAVKSLDALLSDSHAHSPPLQTVQLLRL
jgi:hypothetical protein